MPTLGTAARPTVLSGWRTSRRRDLAAHLDHYGPLPPTGGDFSTRFVRAVEAAGLAGRGGAGFPAAVKLEGHRRAQRRATLVVNAMEGEPASGKDRVLCTCAPHLVLDGAEVAAAVIGAGEVVVCVADGEDDMAEALDDAMAERAHRSRSPVPVRLARPPGRYVAGEESALVGWLDRGRGTPAFRPVRGVPQRLGRQPVLVHNAETLAHMALVARQVAGWGAEDGAGSTMLVTLSGAVAHPGVLEVPVGTPLSDLVEAARPSGPPQAALVGGFGGTWVEAARFAVPFGAAALRELGAAPGAGVVVVLGQEACGVAETARIAAYMAGESAGQCGPCVYGLPAIADDLAQLAAGRGGHAAVARCTERMAMVAGRGACRHPDGVTRMVASALTVFDGDVEAHAAGRPCRFATRPSVVPLGRPR